MAKFIIKEKGNLSLRLLNMAIRYYLMQRSIPAALTTSEDETVIEVKEDEARDSIENFLDENLILHKIEEV